MKVCRAVPRIRVLVAVAAAAACNQPAAGPAAPGPAPQATVLSKVSGDNQTGTVRSAVPAALVVRVVSTTGIPITGASVLWSSTASQSVMSPEETISGAGGVASTQWTLGTTAGTQTALAQASNAPSPVAFTATARAGSASASSILSGNEQTGVRLTALPEPLSVLVTDDFGNPISGVTVTWQFAGDSGTVSPATGTTNSAGRVTAVWTLGPAVPLQAVRASAAGTSVQRFTAIVNAAVPK
jgi:hypothetical protein